VKIGTPFGEFPFVYRRIERRDDGIAVVGTVAGVDSRVVFDWDDARRATIALSVPVGAALVLIARSRRR
jgi:hypothetical protein